MGKKALMLSAHYDSVPSSPGAGDDGAGVAVVLETLRAVKAAPPLERDLIVLFSDGEENGFHGAKLFVNEHPWAKEVGAVLNFDARGNSGPSIMFETSDGNGWLIDQYAQAALHPLATSLSMDIYRIMPNDTDLTVFKDAGMGGLNFAFGGGVAFYHSAEDTPANLDPDTVQHQGENALVTVGRLGRLDLDDTKREDVIYTSIFSRVVLSYSKKWVVPLALAALVLYAAVAAGAVRSGQMRRADLAVGAGVLLAAMCASLIAVGILVAVGIGSSAVSGLSYGTEITWEKFDVPIMTGFALVATILTLALARSASKERSLIALASGALLWWLALSLATAFWLPGASYLFVWPTLAGLAGLGVSSRSRPGSALAWGAAVLASVPSLVLLPPLIRETFEGLSLRMAAPIVILVVLFIGTMLPILGPLVAVERSREPGSAHTPEPSADQV
jgi:hypothetical protein